MTTTSVVESIILFVAIYCRHKTNKTVLIKIANMPFGQEDELRAALANHWSTLGKVLDVQPYMFPGRQWLTKRWDILLPVTGHFTQNLCQMQIIVGYTNILFVLILTCI